MERQKKNEKYVLILGGTKGIGKSIALAFTNLNKPSIIVSRSEENLKEIKNEAFKMNAENKNVYLPLDMSKIYNFPELFTEIERKNIYIDALINNLPGGDINNFNTFSYEEIHNCIDNKVVPYLEGIKYAKEYMYMSGGGSIVNIIGGSWKRPDSNMFVNSMINASLVNATMNISKELAEKNININCVHPGYIFTDRYINYREKLSSKESMSIEKAHNLICHKIPFNSIGDTNDLAQIVILLTSENGRYITGQNIDFDGGLSINF